MPSTAVRDYRDLTVWQQSMDLAPAVYTFAKGLPAEERYALGDQMRRAVVSVAANIAEGNARQSTKAYLCHLAIATGSLAELDTLLDLTQRLQYCPSSPVAETRSRIVELRRALTSLRHQLKRRL